MLTGSQDGFEATEQAIRQALDLAEDMHGAYLRSPDHIRRLINQSWFEAIWVHNDPQPAGAKVTEHVAALIGNGLVGRTSARRTSSGPRPLGNAPATLATLTDVPFRCAAATGTSCG